MSKKLFLFDEKKEAEKIVLNGFPKGDIDYNRMYYIAKYFRDEFGYGEKRLQQEIVRFCKEQDDNFNPIAQAEQIKKWVKSAMNYKLRTIESVSVSQKELDFLKTINHPKERKILFVILVLCKALKQRNTRRTKKEFKVSNSYYIHYSNFRDIIYLSQIKNLSEQALAEILYKYKNLFYFYSPEKELIKINFVDVEPETEIIIDNLDNIMSYYDLLLKKIPVKTFCAICGKEIEKKSNRQKLCKECAEKQMKEQDKLRKRIYRKNAKKMRNL